jgi:molecular chaperone DnaJ
MRGGRGDLRVKLQIETPTKLDAKQKELFRTLAKLRKTDTPKLAKQRPGVFGKRR